MAVLLGLLFVLLFGLREVGFAVVAGYEVQPIGVCRVRYRLERAGADIADRRGRQAGMQTGVVRRIIINRGRLVGQNRPVKGCYVRAQRNTG